MVTTLVDFRDTTASPEAVRQFEAEGFWGPIRVLSAGDCRQLLEVLRLGEEGRCLDWGKGGATRSRAFYDLAHHPRILETIAPLLGDNFMLWGAKVVSRRSGAIHPWHSDIESATCGGRTVSVWIGLENTTPDSALLFLPRTHRFGVTIQEVEFQHGRDRESTSDEEVIRWAQERDARSRVLNPDVTNGDALFFDGRLWHGSNNRFTGSRRALLLQYATPDAVVRIPDLNFLQWPFNRLEIPRPPCIMIRGQGDPAVNRIVPGPLPEGTEAQCELRSRIHPLRTPLSLPVDVLWKPYPLFKGTTAHLCHLTCHASTLAPGHAPHPPHRHIEEELLLLLDGEVDLVLPEAPPAFGGERVRLKPGEFVYYPANFPHTLEPVGEMPANYLMFKWHNEHAVETPAPALSFNRWSFRGEELGAATRPGFHPRALFGEPTRWLRRLHCHTTLLEPGAGYDPHVDAYDVAIVVQSGELETLGVRALPNDVIFYRSGEAHGMRNPGEVPARYVVFEFHGRAQPVGVTLQERTLHLLAKITDPRRWKRKIGRLVRRGRRKG